jgi:teichuronic acid biosynthesis glycosyltransferase TuaC
MWPSPAEQHAGEFIRASVARGPEGVRNVVLVPRLVLTSAHGRIWGRGVQGWQRQRVQLQPPHRLLEYRTVRVPRVGEAAARVVGARFALAAARERPRLFHGHFLLGPAPAAVRLASQYGVPSVITAHGTDVGFLEHGLPGRRVSEILRACVAATRILAVSSALAARLSDLGVDRDRIEVLSMGVDEFVFRPGDRATARAELDLDLDDRIVLFVGRFSPEKGGAVFVDAVRRLGGDVTAYAAGPTTMDTKPVRALGILSGDELARWLAAADVMCLPSLAEGMPVSIMEALAVGTPVVATDVGGIPDQVRPQLNGLLVPPGDPASLSTALRDALGAEWSAAAIRRTSEPFWWTNISARLGAVYREITDKPQ